MAILKCKNCGGDVIAKEGELIGICEYCGSTMTLPKIEDEQRIALFNRGNHFRMRGEYDRALTVFEQLLALDTTDPEAHWNVALCRFGIEYVEEDPDSHNHIPTCHRASWDSILTDVDYLAALQYADPSAKEIYEAEATYIDNVQKGILAISKSEAPYDIFICYKETTDGGSRTKDSVYAQNLYARLTKEGYRVFFARITLESKLGQQYEPYIFAALNSAKVMLVIGTDADNFKAPWVRNEWGRYLNLLKKDNSRLLIPCYRDMDAYELPDELSMLQCQDMNKIGFEQDLLRGIQKILHPPNVDYVSGINLDSLVRRGFILADDCEWKQADACFDRALDVTPESFPAYLGKILVENRIRSVDELKKSEKPLSGSNYRHAMRFASTAEKTLIDEIEECIKQNIDNKERGIQYNAAVHQMETSCVDSDFDKAATQFEYLADFRDSKEKAILCRQASEEFRNKKIYDGLIEKMDCAIGRELFDEVASGFETLGDYLNSVQYAKLCRESAITSERELEETRLRNEQKVLEKEQQRQIDALKRKKASNQRKRYSFFILGVAIVSIALFVLMRPIVLYNIMQQNAERGEYSSAYSICQKIKNYRDCSELQVQYACAWQNINIEDMATTTLYPWFSVTDDGTLTFDKMKYPNNTDGVNDVVIPPVLDGIVVRKIGDNSFSYAAKVNCVVIPDSVTEIGAGSFKYCRYLKRIVLSSNLKIIGTEAFYFDDQIEQITLPASITQIHENAFSECDGFEKIFYQGTPEAWTHVTIRAGNEALLNIQCNYT